MTDPTVTPEMIEAGAVAAHWNLSELHQIASSSAVENAVKAIYRAMERIRRQSESEP